MKSKDNTRRFETKAALYQQFRPAYPEAYFDYLLSKTQLMPEDAVADIGSGTGIFSRQLLERGLSVYAVEPNSNMRSKAEQQLGANPRFFSVPGSAEHTLLADSSVALVTAAQAFHWFDQKKFGAECRRILKPGGKVALVWNIRSPDSPVTQKCQEAFRRFCENFSGFTGSIMQNLDQVASFFCGACPSYRTWANDLHYDWDAFLGRMLSSSYAPQKESPAYAPLVAALRQIFQEESENGILRFPMQTISFLGMPT